MNATTTGACPSQRPPHSYTPKYSDHARHNAKVQSKSSKFTVSKPSSALPSSSLHPLPSQQSTPTTQRHHHHHHSLSA